MADINVTVRTPKTDYAFGERLEFEITVENLVQRPLYIVEPIDDSVYPYRISETELEVFVSIPDLSQGDLYCTFAMPKMTLLNAGESLGLRKAIAMPPREVFLDADHSYRERFHTLSGSVNVSITIGYTYSFPILSLSDPWSDFSAAQLLSDPVSLALSIAAPSPGLSSVLLNPSPNWLIRFWNWLVRFWRWLRP
jgi:hypothetical protein